MKMKMICGRPGWREGLGRPDAVADSKRCASTSEGGNAATPESASLARNGGDGHDKHRDQAQGLSVRIGRQWARSIRDTIVQAAWLDGSRQEERGGCGATGPVFCWRLCLGAHTVDSRVAQEPP